MTALPLDREALDRYDRAVADAIESADGQWISMAPGDAKHLIAQSRVALDLEARVEELEREREEMNAKLSEVERLHDEAFAKAWRLVSVKRLGAILATTAPNEARDGE